MSRFLAVALAALAVPALALPAAAAPVTSATYDPASRTLAVSAPAGILPSILVLTNPPRFVVDLPDTTPAKIGDVSFASGPVHTMTLARFGNASRVVLRLNQPLGNQWSAAIAPDGRLLFRLFGGAPAVSAAAPVAPTPTAKPSAAASPAPVAPQTPKPTAHPSAKPTASPAAQPSLTPVAPGTPKPTPTPIPVMVTPKPTAAPATPKPAVTAAPQGNLSHVGPILYDESIRFLTIGLTKRIEPRFTMNGETLLLDLPGAALAKPFEQTYPEALVSHLKAEQTTPTNVRLTLHFARPVGKAWTLKQSNNRLILIFDRRPLDAMPMPATLAPSQAPTAAPTAAPATPTPATPAPATPAPTKAPATPAPATPAPTAAPTTGYPFGGTVTSLNDTAPVEGASIVAGNYRTMTDSTGRFNFNALPAGKHVVTITARGFAPQTFEILIPEDRELAINLVPSL